MEKYLGIYKNGKEIVVWAIDMKAAKFHLKDNVRLYLKENNKLAQELEKQIRAKYFTSEKKENVKE